MPDQIQAIFEEIVDTLKSGGRMRSLDTPIVPSTLTHPELQGELYSPVTSFIFPHQHYRIQDFARPITHLGGSFYDVISPYALEVMSLPVSQKDVQNNTESMKSALVCLVPPAAFQQFARHCMQTGFSKEAPGYATHTDPYFSQCKKSVQYEDTPARITPDTINELRALAHENEGSGREARERLQRLDIRPYLSAFPELAVAIIAYGSIHRQFIDRLRQQVEQSSLDDQEKQHIQAFFAPDSLLDINLKLDNLFRVIVPLVCAEYASATIQELDPARRLRQAISLAMLDVGTLNLFETNARQGGFYKTAEGGKMGIHTPEGAHFDLPDEAPERHFVCPAKAHIEKTLGTSTELTQKGHAGTWLCNAVDHIRDHPALFADIMEELHEWIIDPDRFPPIEINENGACPDGLLSGLASTIKGILR